MFTAKKSLAAAACVLALLFPGAGCLGETRDQFSDGSFEETVVIPQGGGSNSSVAFDLPRNVSVTGASLDIEGRQADYGLTTTVLDFQKPLGSTAWAGTAAGAPPVLPPSSYESTNITLVPGIRKSDDIRYTTSTLNNLPYHLIEFYVGRDLLVSFNLSWEGIGFSDPQMGFGNNGADLYLWDSSRLSWKAMDSEGMGEVPVEVTLGARVLVNAGDYVDLEGRINALVCPAWMYSNRVETDYVKLDFTGISHGRPFNVTLDVGADNTTDWSHPGLFQDNETFSGPAFVQALQACLDNASTDPVRIPLKFTSDGGGVLFLSNLSIEHSPKDLPPFLKKAVPSFALEEDGRLFGALDISEHFGDDGGSAKLKFSVAWMDDPGKVLLAVNGTRLDLFANLTDWYGQVTARLRATDAKGQWADSNNFSVRVTPVDDPPRLERPGELVAHQDAPFAWKFNATDADLATDFDEALTFSTDAALFKIDGATGTVRFTPHNQDVGSHRFNVTVRDHQNASDTLNVTLVVVNANDPPVLGPLEDATATEGKLFTLGLQATDPDLVLGLDSLRFSANWTALNLSEDGLISFIPGKNEVGIHIIGVTVSDTGGLVDRGNFTLTVLNINDPPVIGKLPDMTFSEHQNVSFWVNASDPDAGDGLAFSSETPLFTITRDGWVNFTPEQKDVGDWVVRITVRDREGASASTGFMVRVENVNDPPGDVGILNPAEGSKFAQGKAITFEAAAVDDDGDALEYGWYVDAKLVGTGKAFTTKAIRPGMHSVRVSVSDGTDTNTSVPVHFKVFSATPAAKGFIPGFTTAAAAAAGALAVVALALTRGRPNRRRK